MMRAIAMKGVQSGIREFIRYGYHQRNNMATHFAIPLGRIRVPDRITHNLFLLDDIDIWFSKLRGNARAKKASTRAEFLDRKFGDALFALINSHGNPLNWQRLLTTASIVEAYLKETNAVHVGPLPPLRPEWVRAADDGSPEFRLALSCALQYTDLRKANGKGVDGVRRHWLPLEGNRFAVSKSGGEERIRHGPEVVIMGKRGLDDALALVRRRLAQAVSEPSSSEISFRKGGYRLPLVAAKGAAAHPADLARLMAGEVDLDRTMKLACALMALDRHRWSENPMPPAPPAGAADDLPEEAWMVVRLATAPWTLPVKNELGVDPVIFRRLESGDAASAVRIAAGRLRQVGIAAAPRFAFVSPKIARLWAAALAFPIDRHTAKVFVRRIDPQSLKEEAA